MYKSRRSGKSGEDKKPSRYDSKTRNKSSRGENTSTVDSGNPMGLPVLGAEVIAIESHSKKPHMYWVTLKLELDGSTLDVEVEQTAILESSSEDKDENWNEEVDALIAGAQTLRIKGRKLGRDEEVGVGAGAGESTITVHEDTLVSWRLLKGRQLTSAEYEVLRQDEQKEDAYRSALMMLEFKARTTVELSRALKRKGYVPEVVVACLERLKAMRMVDDTAYAKRFTEQRAVGQRKGRMLIRQELMQRGVGREDVDQAIGELDGQVEQEAALALARKRWPSTKGNDRERKMKLMGVLLRRGFPSGVVRSAVQQAATEMGGAGSDTDFSDDYQHEPEYMED
ncbi:regulatory protein RecX [Cohnella mopanensis]|uniref:regulatory protein RecX n=1 Tax=Cohnella mopanensis TaxID=2911966 RepID=UPI001EF88145|nr:regulatory protein RecX [Cohnella mopanensis]